MHWNHKILTDKELSEVVELAQQGNAQAIDVLVKSNIRLCAKLARKYTNFGATNLEDLTQESVLGLIEAIDKFDPGRQVKFTTFAATHMRKRILAFVISNHSQVKIGTNNTDKKLFWRLNRAVKAIQANGEEPTAQAIADRLEVPVQAVKDMRVRLGSPETSLQAVNPKTGNELMDSLATDSPDPEEFATERNEYNWITDKMIRFEQGLKTQAEHLTWNYRIASQTKSCEQIAELLGTSKQWVNQVEQRLHNKFVNYARNQM